MNEEKTTYWKKNYTWVLLFNAIYILIFYIMMELFS